VCLLFHLATSDARGDEAARSLGAQEPFSPECVEMEWSRVRDTKQRITHTQDCPYWGCTIPHTLATLSPVRNEAGW